MPGRVNMGTEAGWHERDNQLGKSSGYAQGRGEKDEWEVGRDVTAALERTKERVTGRRHGAQARLILCTSGPQPRTFVPLLPPYALCTHSAGLPSPGNTYREQRLNDKECYPW